MSRTSVAVALVAALALGACTRRGETAARQTAAAALRGVIVFPHSVPLAYAAGDSAGQLTLTAPAAPQVVADWYRVNLRLNRWELQSDRANADGSVALYAERAGRPLWITIQPNVGGPGATYQLIGAVTGSQDSTRAAADSAPGDTAAAQRSGSSMSSNRIQRRQK